MALRSVTGFAQEPAARRGSQSRTPSGVTFTETIAPILYANCVTCHRAGEAAPFPLISYEDVAKRARLIAEVTESRYMPPWHAAHGYGEFLGERRLSDAQIATIGAWVKAGMPRGDAAKMPKLPAFPADGWRLGQPDLILEMPAGFDLPASGADVFRNFVIPTRLTEDKWVRGVEFRPSARRVVHHALFAQVTGGSLSARDGADGRPGFGGMGAVGAAGARGASGSLGGWAVGATPRMLPEGIALRLPKGSDFLLQMHFHLSGKPETEKSLIGIFFADKAPDKDLFTVELPALFGLGAGIDIPPGEPRYTIQDSFTLPGDVRVYSAMAHAHYLAKEMKATATLPDGSARPLIWINDWDFNWQDSYVYKEPFTLPKGTRLDVTLTYDNSDGNPRNPTSPPRRALWGEQSLDEMGTVGFGFEVLNKADVPSFQEALAARSKAAIAAGGKDGTVGRFLASQLRQSRGLQQLTVFDRKGTVVGRVGEPGVIRSGGVFAGRLPARGDQAGSQYRHPGRVGIRHRDRQGHVHHLGFGARYRTGLVSRWTLHRVRIRPREHPRPVPAGIGRYGQRRAAVPAHDRRANRPDGLVGRWPLPLFLVRRHDVHPPGRESARGTEADRAGTGGVLRARWPVLARQPLSRVQLEPVRPLSDLRQILRAFIDRRKDLLTCGVVRRSSGHRFRRRVESEESSGERTAGNCFICRSRPGRQ